MLFEAAAHEPLSSASWDEGRVRETIRAIVASVEEAYAAGGLWRLHPLDAEVMPDGSVSTSLYFGAAGTLRGVAYLASVGAAETSLDLADVAAKILAADLTVPPELANSLMA